MKSLLFTSLNSDHTSSLVDVHEVALGISKLTFDDAYFQFGFSERTKYYIEFLKVRLIKEQKAFMNFEGSNPMAVFYFGMFPNGNIVERFDYDMVEVLGNTGGIIDVLFVISTSLVFFFMDIN